MAYVATIHKPTSVRHALRMRLLSDEEESLVIAQSNRLQIWRVTAEGMTCLYTKSIFGSISVLQRLRPKASDIDLLFVGTDRHEYFSLVWNKYQQRLDTIQQLHDQSEPFMNEADSLDRCLVDPTGKFMAMHLWEGVLNISRLVDRGESRNVIKFMEQVRISELFLKSSAFLYSQVGPRIAFLFQSRNDIEDAQLSVYKLTADDRHATAAKFSQRDRVFQMAVPDKMARMLIPVPIAEDENKRHHVRNTAARRAHLGGILAIGETSILYVDTLDFTTLDCHLREGNIFIAWAEYDGTRYFLADDFGRLHLLTILTDGVLVTGVEVVRLDGKGPAGERILLSKASCLTYMGDGMLFIGSHHGDSQLIHVDVNGDPGWALTLANAPPAMYNNAPILDFVVMDLGNREGDSHAGNSFSSGQARIVAGCGAEKDGSLRSIRSGVGLEDLGILDEFNNVRGLFTLKSHGSPKTDVLVVTSLLDTRVFKFDHDGAIEELSTFQGMTLDQQTLLAANLPSGRLLQITPDFVAVIDSEDGLVVDRWVAEDTRKEDDEKDLQWKISKASQNGTWVLLSLDGRRLVSLNIADHLRPVVKNIIRKRSARGDTDQISCVHISPLAANVGVVGFWKLQAVTFCDLETLDPHQKVDLPSTEDSAVVARDAVLVQLHPPHVSGPTLLVAQDDGNVLTCDINPETWEASSRKSVILGTSEARLHVLPRDNGTCNVFATTEHSSLIYSDHGRIMYSATTADDATYVAPFDSEAYPDCIVIATADHIRISEVDTERRTHVTTLKVGETVRRLAYSPIHKAFGIGCVQKELIKGAEVITTSFKLADEIVFQLLGKPHKFDCDKCVEIPECVIRAALPNCHDELVERFIVGTAILPEDPKVQPGPAAGRIWVFGVDDNRNVYVVGSADLKGPCKCLAMMGNRVVAGLQRTVVVYDYHEDNDGKVSLQKLATYRPSTCPKDISVHGNIIAVADLMKSLVLVEFTPPAKNIKAKLEEKARHFQSAWATALCHVEGESWLEAEASGTLLVLRRNADAITDFEKRQLEVTSELNLGEQVNRIRPLNVSAGEGAIIAPKAFLGTVNGGMYLFGTIHPDYMDLLMGFQSRLADMIETPGGISFKNYRSSQLTPKVGEGKRGEPWRFVDGELLERFLDMTEPRQEVVCEGTGHSAEYMRGVVEQLRRLH